ncbi:MAG: Lrp/AsnC family transcriptional regulator [Candidatus Lokiarchaeota archaeon]|nr:Lrp/AsnC family transcriptional regulator [Candidatus Lokiarchaeota archaeon]MBD3200675.1 Lrp/AsnC family transcriptional regulator [Candidatus Lokiarchaeota archaeon]
MTQSYIFMKIKAGFVETVIDELRNMEEVIDANAVTGGVDVIAKVEGKDIQTISKVILTRIHRIDGVERTSTHIIVPT